MTKASNLRVFNTSSRLGRMKRIIAICVFGSVVNLVSATELRQFYDSAVISSFEKAGAAAREQAANADVAVARAEYLPQISFNYTDASTDQDVRYSSQAAIDGNQTSYDTEERYWLVTQTLFDVPKAYAMRASKVQVQQVQSEGRSDVLSFGHTMVSLYLEALSYEEQISVAKAQVDYLEARGAREQGDLAAGRITPSVYAVTLASLSEAETELARGLGNYSAVRDSFCALAKSRACPLPKTPRPIDRSRIEIPASQLLTFDDWKNDIPQHPDLVALKLAQARVDNEMGQVSSGFLPIVSLEYENRTDDNGGSIFDGSSVVDKEILRLRARVNLFEGGKKFAQRARKVEEIVDLQSEWDIRYRELEADLRRASSSLDVAIRSDESFGRALDQQSRVVALAQRQVDAGFETPDKVLEVQAEYVRISVAQYRARREAVQALADVYLAIGSEPVLALDAIYEPQS